MAKRLYGYHISDARRISEKIKKPIIDVTITSPPYWNLKNYENINGQIGHKQKYDDYLDDLKNIFSYMSGITKDTGSLWVIIDTFKTGGKVKLLPFDLAREIEEDWDLQDIIIWQKDKTLPWSHKGKFRNIFEYVLFFTKKGSRDYKFYIDRIRDPEDLKEWWIKYPERYNPKGKTPTKVWRESLEDVEDIERLWEEAIPVQGKWGNGYVRHSCPFPPHLIENILLLTTDEKDVVLDLFAGSGSVLAQAKVMKRKPIGFDINEKYKQMYEEKVLPEFKLRWKSRKKELREKEKKQQELEETIKKLRQLKYPKELVKRSSKNGFFENIDSDLESIFVLSNGKDWTQPNIYFVFSDKVDKKKVLEKFKEIYSKPPLSKYGIFPEFNIYSKKTITNNWKSLGINNKLYLYSNGKTYDSQKELSFTELTILMGNVLGKNMYPLIISDLKVAKEDLEKNLVYLSL